MPHRIFAPIRRTGVPALVVLATLALAGCIRDSIPPQPPAPAPTCPDVVTGDSVSAIYTIAGGDFNGDGEGDVGFKDNVQATCSPLYFPVRAFVDDDGSVLFVDWNNHRVRRIDPVTGMISTIVNQRGTLGDDPPHSPLFAEEKAVDCALNHPTAIIRRGQDLVLAAWHNHRIKVIHPDGMMQTFSGSSEQFGDFSGDNGKCYLAQHNLPSSIAYDDSGNAYVSDQGNLRIRKINPDSIITTFAGTYTIPSFGGDGGDALKASYAAPKGADAVPCWRLAFDRPDPAKSGVIYLADTHNNRIRVISLDPEPDPSDPSKLVHIVTTFAGGGPPYPQPDPGIGCDNCDANSAYFDFPSDVVVGPDHAVYVCDSYHNRVCRIDPVTHILTTVAGNGQQGYSGDGSPATDARLNHPLGIWVDGRNGETHLYICDTENQRVRRVRLQ